MKDDVDKWRQEFTRLWHKDTGARVRQYAAAIDQTRREDSDKVQDKVDETWDCIQGSIEEIS